MFYQVFDFEEFWTFPRMHRASTARNFGWLFVSTPVIFHGTPALPEGILDETDNPGAP
jgi:hypothetical protein